MIGFLLDICFVVDDEQWIGFVQNLIAHRYTCVVKKKEGKWLNNAVKNQSLVSGGQAQTAIFKTPLFKFQWKLLWKCS